MLLNNDAYIALHFEVEPLQPGVEILIAELGAQGFESFVENEEGVAAYIQKKDFFEGILDTIQILNNPEFRITFSSEEIQQQNWNAEWEHNFDPIRISDRCVVRAPFHEPFNVEYEIVIAPKMSFGTGHHETTHLMLKLLLETDLEGKTVLDMGCGTAVLAILSEMRGAESVDAIDIDSWSVENSEENIGRNNCMRIKVVQGDASSLNSEKKYDRILANINRNILLNDIPIYVKSLQNEGQLFLSGFYEEDLERITDLCNKLGLHYVEHQSRNNWVAVKFVH